MNRKLSLLLLMLINLYSFGQISFEKGYLINKEDQKIDCFLKNYDWEKNPKEIEYKIGETDTLLKGDLSNVKEFGIPGVFKFIRVETKIDRSSKEFKDLTKQRNPIWSDEIFFLKVMIEGKASLYSYKERNFERFFYSVSVNTFQQLIYKEYLVDNHTVAYNFDFRQQLWNDLQSEDINMSALERIGYNRQELENYFREFNESFFGAPVINYNDAEGRESFFLKLTPGMNYSSITIRTIGQYVFQDYTDKSLNFRLGIESGFILPFNKNKWAFIIEPMFEYFKTQNSNITVNYSVVEFPVGARYFFFLDNNTKIFVNALYIPAIKIYFDNSLEFLELGITSRKFDMASRNCISFGTGVDYKKASFELRYYTNSDLLSEYAGWGTGYHRLSFILGYRLFKSNH